MLVEAPTPATDTMPDENKVDRRRRPERRFEILKAVMSLLEKGHRRVTTADLAAEVGLSEAALYRHFTGKDAIFHALTEYLQEHLLKAEDQLVNKASSSLSQLRQICEYHLQFFSDHPGMCRIFLVEGVVTRSESVIMNNIIKDYGKQIQAILAKAQDAGELPKKLALEAATNFYIGLIQAATLRFVMSGFTAKPLDELPVLWEFFCRGVGAAEK
ncbi:MAG: TetR family transcriptional regulator [Magnetococcus sp. YQC-5]